MKARPDWPKIALVQQTDDYGCFIACLAMITGKPYALVKAELGPNACANCGVTDKVAFAYLAAHGYAVARFTDKLWFHPKKKRIWPPKPFADVHIAGVRSSPYSTGGHAVIVLRNGTVLDPEMREPQKLSTYQAVTDLAAVVPLP